MMRERRRKIVLQLEKVTRGDRIKLQKYAVHSLLSYRERIA